MSPFFSIIIPVYNAARYLRECLDSVLAQTFTDWEAICVDDGSIDGSGAILDDYADSDKRFRVFHQKNVGASAARNKALDEVRGEYVLIIDADDKIAPNVPIEVLRLMGDIGLDFCSIARHNPWVEPDAKLGSTRKVFYGQIQKNDNTDEGISNAIDILRKIGMSSSGVIYRRTFLDRYNLRYPNGIHWNEDFVFITSLVLKGARFGFYDEIGYIVSFHDDSISHHVGENVFLSRCMAASEIMAMIRNVCLPFEFVKYYASRNKYQIFGGWCEGVHKFIREYTSTYRAVLTIWARILNNLVIIFPSMWYGKVKVLRMVDRLLVHYDWYYKKG